jgi:hypothetical protein
MGTLEKTIKQIAVPLTGWVVTDEEAEAASRQLLKLTDVEFRTVCRTLSWYALGDESPHNKIARMLDNLPSSQKVDLVLQRMLDVAASRALAVIPKGITYPFAAYVIFIHGELRSMGMGTQGALRLLDNAIAEGKFNRAIRRNYESAFGTDNATGWDKAMHFTKAARIAYYSPADAYVASYGKEWYDEIESWFGKDPEGYSEADINADMMGIKWGKTLRKNDAYAPRWDRW